MADKTLPPAKAVVDSSIRLLRTYVDAANKLPTGDDYDYHSVFPGFVETVNSHKERLDKIVNIFANVAVSPQRQRKLLSSESRNRILDVVDMMFENIDTLLDEVHGAKMSAEAQNAAFDHVNGASVMDADDDDATTIEAKRHSKSFASSSSAVAAASSSTTTARKTPLVTIARPQLQFTRPVDNSTEPFKPLIFNAETHDLAYGTPGVHPYKQKIESFAYTGDQLRYREEILPAPLAQTNLHFVTSVADLDAMITNHLSTSKDIAIDLEHHDIHSYQGITSLMQISTRTDDFLVDVFPLRDHLHRLNKVFLDPTIVKVLHGCKEDIRWLQKDFGCYIVNLFDTGAALQTLHMPCSLAFAVDHYCQVKLNKQYQRADWRVRPLPSDMVHYARQDTHYLLYIYDRLSNQLLQQEGGRAAVLGNLLVHVLNESRQLCLLQYEKPTFNPQQSYLDGLGKGLLGFTPAQSERARVMYNWRENVARIEDESPAAVMHSSSIIHLAVSPAFSKANPPTATQLLRSIHPLSMAVRSQIKGLVDAMGPTYTDGDEKAPSGGAGHATAGSKSVDASDANNGQQRARRQLRHYPLSGTLPSIVNRNANAMGNAVELDVGNSAAGELAGAASVAPAAASPTFVNVLAAQRAIVAKASSLYTAVLPPTSPCLAKRVVAPAGMTMESTVDKFGVVRPGARETLLMKAIRAEKATTHSGDADAGDDDDGILPDEIGIPARPADDEEAVVGEKRSRDQEAEAAPTAAPLTADDKALPMSLKDQFGLGRQQRKQHRKE